MAWFTLSISARHWAAAVVISSTLSFSICGILSWTITCANCRLTFYWMMISFCKVSQGHISNNVRRPIHRNFESNTSFFRCVLCLWRLWTTNPRSVLWLKIQFFKWLFFFNSLFYWYRRVHHGAVLAGKLPSACWHFRPLWSWNSLQSRLVSCSHQVVVPTSGWETPLLVAGWTACLLTWLFLTICSNVWK